jgi:putative aminopeptidase FrvX
MDTLQLIENLSNMPGVSGFEGPVTDVARQYLDTSVQIEEDRMRNLFIHKPPSRTGLPKVMLDAHSDEVGFMIQSINANGTLRFMTLGGWNPQNINAHVVRIQNTQKEWIKGVVASKPAHFLTPEEMKAALSIDKMVIDVGATSKEQVEQQFHIKIGAPVVPDVCFSYDEKTDLMIGKAFDDRLGCAALLEVMNHHIKKDLELDVYAALSTQEELGLRGAKVSVKKINPDVAICLEGTPADDTFNPSDFIQAGIGKGPQIRHMDRSVLANPKFVEFAVNVAQTHHIPIQEAVRSGGGNNAGVITLHDRSVPTITLGIPVRYIHSHHCIATLSDFKHTVNWCTCIINSLTPQIIEAF